MSENNFDKQVFTVVALLLIALAIGAFWLSFNAISKRAVDAGMIGWVFALMVDGAILVFAVSAFYAKVNGRSSTKNWMLAFSLLFVGLSVWFNVGAFDARSMHGLQTAVIHALPPTALLIAFEWAFIPLLHIVLEKSDLINTIETVQRKINALTNEYETSKREKERELSDVQNEIERGLNTMSKIRANIATLELEKATQELTERQREIFEHIQNSNATSYNQLANELKLSKNQVYQPIQQMIKVGLISKTEDQPFAVCLN